MSTAAAPTVRLYAGDDLLLTVGLEDPAGPVDTSGMGVDARITASGFLVGRATAERTEDGGIRIKVDRAQTASLAQQSDLEVRMRLTDHADNRVTVVAVPLEVCR